MDTKLITVDDKDNIIGYETKKRCHTGTGIMHRAFSIFIFNNDKHLLIQKRSKHKELWPLYWSNTCCSHPNISEDYVEAAKRRLMEEMNISCPLTYLYKFTYQANYKNLGSENEMCAVLIGKYNKSPKINKLEIDDYKWIDLFDLKTKISENSDIYTPWFKLELEQLFSNYMDDIDAL